MIDFAIPEEHEVLRQRVRRFIADEVIPREGDPRQDRHGPSDELRLELARMAKEAGLLSPHAPTAWGGLGLDHRGMAVLFEEAGYSPLGPIALNIQPPDEGNTNLLDQVATDAQKERYLAPMVRAEQRSAFCMTEPDGGAGSDPRLLKTVARQRADGSFSITGRKWLVTGFPGAAFVIVMARAEDTAGEDLGATMFMFESDREGVAFVKQMNTIDNNSPGGHAVVDFNGVTVTQDEILGEIGAGFRYAQVRLGPARVTHCMRWLGAARRSHEIAQGYAETRHAFGRPIVEHQGVNFMLADNEIDLHTSRLVTWHACWLLDQGQEARTETSIAKVHCSEALGRVVDRSLQVLGGKGISDDTVIERIYRDIRAFRIYDGPSEVHRFSIARATRKR